MRRNVTLILTVLLASALATGCSGQQGSAPPSGTTGGVSGPVGSSESTPNGESGRIESATTYRASLTPANGSRVGGEVIVTVRGNAVRLRMKVHGLTPRRLHETLLVRAAGSELLRLRPAPKAGADGTVEVDETLDATSSAVPSSGDEIEIRGASADGKYDANRLVARGVLRAMVSAPPAGTGGPGGSSAGFAAGTGAGSAGVSQGSAQGAGAAAGGGGGSNAGAGGGGAGGSGGGASGSGAGGAASGGTGGAGQ